MPMLHMLPIFLDIGIRSHQKLIAVARGVPDVDGLFCKYLDHKDMDKVDVVILKQAPNVRSLLTMSAAALSSCSLRGCVLQPSFQDGTIC